MRENDRFGERDKNTKLSKIDDSKVQKSEPKILIFLTPQ